MKGRTREKGGVTGAVSALPSTTLQSYSRAPTASTVHHGPLHVDVHAVAPWRGSPSLRAAASATVTRTDEHEDAASPVPTAAPQRVVVDAETGEELLVAAQTAAEAVKTDSALSHLRVLHADAASAVRLQLLLLRHERELQAAASVADALEKQRQTQLAREPFVWRRRVMAAAHTRDRVHVRRALEELKREQEARLLQAAKVQRLLM